MKDYPFSKRRKLTEKKTKQYLKVLRPFEHATVNVGIYIAGPINRTVGVKTFRDDFMKQANMLIDKEEEFSILKDNRDVYFINCERDIDNETLKQWKDENPQMNLSQQDWEQQYMKTAKVMAFFFAGFFTRESSHGFDMRNSGPTTRMEFGGELENFGEELIVGYPETSCSNAWLVRQMKYHERNSPDEVYVLTKGNYEEKKNSESNLFPLDMTVEILRQTVKKLKFFDFINDDDEFQKEQIVKKDPLNFDSQGNQIISIEDFDNVNGILGLLLGKNKSVIIE